MTRITRIAAAMAFVAIAAACGGDDDTATITTGETAITVESTTAPTDPVPATDAPEPTDPPATDAPAATDPPVTDPPVTDTMDVPGGEVTAPGPLAVTEVDFTTGMATITNVGDEPYDLTGHWFCNRPSYDEFPAETLEPGASIEAGFGDFAAGGGEMAVYSSNSFGSSDDIIAYVTWGAAGGRLGVAEDAGIWSGDPVMPVGDVITLTGDATSAAGWG